MACTIKLSVSFFTEKLRKIYKSVILQRFSLNLGEISTFAMAHISLIQGEIVTEKIDP